MSDADSCIASLLETSVRHTPHFDWVLAHIGSCFPHTVTHRVLSVGLRDFMTSSQEAGPGARGETIMRMTPRLSSVVNILSHLTSTHMTDVQTALHQLLVTSVTGPSSPVNTATLPFILSLSSVSSGVRRSLTTDLDKLISPVIDQLPEMFSSWTSYYYNSTTILQAVNQLLLATDRGGPQLLLLLLQSAAGGGNIATAARTILNTTLADLFNQVHAIPKHRQDEIPLFTGMAPVLAQIQKMLLHSNPVIVDTSGTLVYLYCLYKGRSVSAGVLKYILCHSTKTTHLVTLLKLLDQLEQFHINVVKDAVTLAIRDVNTNKEVLMVNLIKLCNGDMDNITNSWTAAVRSCQSQLGQLLSRPNVHKNQRTSEEVSETEMCLDLTKNILQLLVLVPPDQKMRVRNIYRLSQAVVNVILDTVTGSDTCEDKLSRVATCESILHHLCSLNCGLQIILRFLLDACINTSFCTWLGGSLKPEDGSARQQQAVSLVQDNYKHGTKPVQPLGSTVTYHAGVIGRGARPTSPDQVVSSDQAEVNRRLMSGVIQRLCEVRGGEGAKQLSLMLVEMISPDIMYNGLPWPEEEFIKVTIERDLSISRVLARHPITWTLLSLLARTRPALCYCSVLVRAVLAVLISHWSSHVTSSLSHHPQQLEVTVKVLDLMAVGQFIPPQLGLVPHIIHIFDPFQLHCILIDIWNFMKINVPGPSLYVENVATGQVNRNFGHYKNYHGFCERLRVVLVKNLDTMAVVFKKYFVDALQENGEKGQNGHC